MFHWPMDRESEKSTRTIREETGVGTVESRTCLRAECQRRDKAVRYEQALSRLGGVSTFLIIELLCTDSIAVLLRCWHCCANRSDSLPWFDGERNPDVVYSPCAVRRRAYVFCFALISEERRVARCRGELTLTAPCVRGAPVPWHPHSPTLVVADYWAINGDTCRLTFPATPGPDLSGGADHGKIRSVVCGRNSGEV